MPARPVKDTYEAQAAQKRKSLALLAVLVAIYMLVVSSVIGAAALAIGALSGQPGRFDPISISWVIGLGALTAFTLAAIQYVDARRNGPGYILKRLGARSPDVRDRYHRRDACVLVKGDGTAVVGITEGLLANFEQDELEAVAAHELAHVVRGDAQLMTFVCAMADFFERLSDSFQPKDEGGDTLLPFSVVLIRLLSRFVGRERELLADAAAVELGRNPAALARALAKAHLQNTFVGDFHESYSPLFMVAPETAAGDATKSYWIDTHPPLMERVRILAEMAHTSATEIIKDVWRERARRSVVRSTAVSAAPLTPLDKDGGRPGKKPPKESESPGRCPRCAAVLVEIDYEGVPVLACRECGGKLVREEDMERILARREVGFGAELLRKAADFRERFVRNPLQTLKISDKLGAARFCPACGYRLASRPFNYQYFVPVDRCLNCLRIWFDADELEVLQILVEDALRE
jgi:Zn-dependent protease with chaperone function/Zn-finger nucleic acid-binding protein